MLQLLVEAAAAKGVVCLNSRQAKAAVIAAATDAVSQLLCTLRREYHTLPEAMLSRLLLTGINSWGPGNSWSIMKNSCVTPQCQDLVLDWKQHEVRALQCVEILIDHGADVNAQQGAPLVAAVTNHTRNHISFLGYLLAKGADVNAGGGAALQAAIRLNNAQAAAVLVKSGANVEPTDLERLLLMSRFDTSPDLTAALRAHNLTGDQGATTSAGSGATSGKCGFQLWCQTMWSWGDADNWNQL
jgi:hypothetical protein